MSDLFPCPRYLDHGEELLWHGRPVAAVQFDFGWADALLIVFGAMVLGAIAFLASEIPTWQKYTLFGASVALGLYHAALHPFLRTYSLRNTRYGLTPRGAVIARCSFNYVKLRRYSITAHTTVQYESGFLGKIWFAQRDRNGRYGNVVSKIGFENLTNAGHPLSIIKTLQSGAS